jgi:hypothetical protein
METQKRTARPAFFYGMDASAGGMLGMANCDQLA